MNRWRFPSLLLGVLLAAPAVANQELDAAFEAAMQRFHLPGLAVGVIENGRVVYKRTQGELIVGSGRKIDSNTLFKIASNSKAMTASTLARLVDAGKMTWDRSSQHATTRIPHARRMDHPQHAGR
jgi:CubicO group peptidase (beta-lactamase class C family)